MHKKKNKPLESKHNVCIAIFCQFSYPWPAWFDHDTQVRPEADGAESRKSITQKQLSHQKKLKVKTIQNVWQ